MADDDAIRAEFEMDCRHLLYWDLSKTRCGDYICDRTRLAWTWFSAGWRAREAAQVVTVKQVAADWRAGQGAKTAQAAADWRDANVERVRAKLHERSQVGIAKYGVTTERGDLSLRDWLTHLQQELMDAAVYVEAALSANRLQPDAESADRRGDDDARK